MTILSPAANFQELGRTNLLKVAEFTPSTGIGKFDARLETHFNGVFKPANSEFHITSRVFFEFSHAPNTEPWTEAEENEFVANMTELVEKTWSGAHMLVSNKDDDSWPVYKVKVIVHLERVSSRGASHYCIKVSVGGKPGSVQAKIVQPADTRKKPGAWEGHFSDSDLMSDVEKLIQNPAITGISKRNKGAYKFRLAQINLIMEKYRGLEAIAFGLHRDDIPGQEAMALHSFCNALLPLISAEMYASGFRLLVYGSRSQRESGFSHRNLAGQRAAAVQRLLNRNLKLPKIVCTACREIVACPRFTTYRFNCPSCQASLEVPKVAELVTRLDREPWLEPMITHLLARKGLPSSAIAKRDFGGAFIMVPKLDEQSSSGEGRYGKLSENGDKYKWQPGPHKFFAAEEKSLPRTYIVIAHEFGHMLGLPDEYLGVNCMALKEEIDLLELIPQVYRYLTNLPQTPIDRSVAQGEGFAALLKAGKVESPIFLNSFDFVTSSIMGAGSDLLPAHYLTIWEALVNCTQPAFLPGEWKIVPSKT